MSHLHKLGHLQGGDWVECIHSMVYQEETRKDGSTRLIASNRSGSLESVRTLVETLEGGTLLLLYVLHTTRTSDPVGRYQSPELARHEVLEFLLRFSDFLAADGRHDLWVHSPAMGCTLVWDRHDRIFGYGQVGAFSRCLQAQGYSEGTFNLPSPHQHYYHAEFDQDQHDLLRLWDWRFSDLKPEDVQFVEP